MAERVTQASRRVAVQPDARSRVTQVSRRVAMQAEAMARVTQVSRRVAVRGWAAVGQRFEIIEMID